ncbi:MAG: 2-oxoglutarate oxidoreductase subunit KorB [Gammaproteobacteria bacterium]|nr:2-oxoglutarate oxidoreductase subunit KorB [Gammaproteobacteria bacterium]
MERVVTSGAATEVTLKPKDYKSDIKPVWCPGCGDFSVLAAITRALAALKVAPENVAVISGIGCSSRIPAYLDTYGFHGAHGRALPLATGLKISRPDLCVLVAGGDGDGFSIGGNHFLQVCRRNVDITYIVMDNQVYGMTKGQASPTTEPDWDRSKLTPHGTRINAFYPLVVALASGANFIARASSSDPNGAAKVIGEAIGHPGFSFVQVLSPCVTFRPEQRDWKKIVRPAPIEATTDPAAAARRLMTDDNFYLGVLYKGNRAPFEPDSAGQPSTEQELEEEFKV